MAQQALAYSVAAAGLITTATAMASLHPHQQVYFNALVDTKTPGVLAQRYDIDYWFLAERQLLERLLARYPDAPLRVWPVTRSAAILPQNDRNRIIFTPPHQADFYLRQRANHRNATEEPAIHRIRAYGSAIAFTIAPGSAAYLDHHRAAYRDVAANAAPLARSDFHIYAYNGSLRYLNENCAPYKPKATDLWIFLHIFPADPDDLPPHRREFGFDNHDFKIIEHAAFFDGKCILSRSLPDYPIARISTGQNLNGATIWRADIDLAAHAAAQALHARILAGDYGPPVAQSHFDLYLRNNALTYLKSPCSESDTHARFFLHTTPANPADLPAAARERGFANLDFHFPDHGIHAADICVATLDLPDYPIARIRTGQHISGEGAIWRAEFPALP